MTASLGHARTMKITGRPALKIGMNTGILQYMDATEMPIGMDFVAATRQASTI